ncbi:hypothetical protein J437_LFUL013278 [Ladona fulva]|uniref:Uncharacterized protein n=1 Tax=Ladona fulva TaxID=123851 RepID=A0A8K0KEY4_LADFU|nr:hypothetical protein J437_LFUL013278 [Ladona fulva]
MNSPLRLPKEEEKLKEYIAPLNKLRNYSYTNGIDFLLDLGRRLRRLDKEKKNFIYRGDFITLMREMDLLNESEAAETFMECDYTNKGFATLDQLIQRFRYPISPLRKRAIEDAVTKADLNFDGLIPLDYLEEIWDGTVQDYLGDDKNAEERKATFLEILRNDAEHKGYVTAEELTNFLWVQSLITEDEVDFALTVRQAFNLDAPPSDLILGPDDRRFTANLPPIVDED